MDRSRLQKAIPKIWIVAPTPPPYGGMSVQAEKLYKRLSSTGIETQLISTNPDPPKWIHAVHKLPGARTVLREIQYLFSLLRISGGPAVVHHFSASYLFFFLHSVPLVFFCRILGVRVILNYRGGKAGDFLKHWAWIVCPIMRLAHTVVVPSEFLRNIFAGYGITCEILPNLADTEAFTFINRTYLAPKFCVTRNLEPMYDVECTLRAFQIIQEQLPHATLDVVGEGSESSRLKELARQWNLSGVRFHGAIPYDQLPAFYRKHDVYLNASRVDNFPGALVEAACAGLPIVTTCAGGIPEMIRHRENGMLCQVGNPEELACSVFEILRDEPLAIRLAQNARMWAEQFSWKTLFPQLMRCYGLQNYSYNPGDSPQVLRTFAPGDVKSC